MPALMNTTETSSLPLIVAGPILRKVTATEINIWLVTTQRLEGIVVILMISFCALLLSLSTTPDSRIKLPKQNIPTSGIAAGKNIAVKVSTISGKIIFSFLDTLRSSGI